MEKFNDGRRCGRSYQVPVARRRRRQILLLRCAARAAWAAGHLSRAVRDDDVGAATPGTGSGRVRAGGRSKRACGARGGCGSDGDGVANAARARAPAPRAPLADGKALFEGNPGNGGYGAPRAPVCARRGGACARGRRARRASPWTPPGARGGAWAGASSGASRDRRRWTRPPRERMSRQPLLRRPRASRCSPRGAISTVATPRWASRRRMGRYGREGRARREGSSASTRRRAGGTVEARARPASLGSLCGTRAVGAET